MPEPAATPWNPDRRWADPLIALLLLLSILTTVEALRVQRKARPEPTHAGIQTRLLELRSAAKERIGSTRPTPIETQAFPWDRAVLSILQAEEGNLSASRQLADATPEAFRLVWRGAYSDGTPSHPQDLEALKKPLGGGYAYARLQARLAERQNQDPAPYRAQARAWALPRLICLGLGVVALLALSLTGIVSFGLLLLTSKGPRAPAQPPCGMSGRAAALAFLGWFLALRFSGTVTALTFSVLPLPKVLALPMAYSFHVWVGARLLLWAEGVSFRQAWRRMTPGPAPRALAWAGAFLGIALVSIFLVGLLSQPFLPQGESPQRDLHDLVAGNSAPLATLLLFTTVAGLAPFFEEWLFRGTLLPWLAHRFTHRWHRAGWPLAVIVSGLAFGAMHLQPTALPGLCTLGMVLGWAFFRTGNLWTTIAMHACWNGGVFIVIRILA